jgi:diguanylate cyclase (GGDEF)-like protein
MIDIDHFKLVNDRYGHPVGDEVIRRIAEIVRSCVRNSDILARYGGEEFIAVLPHSDEDGAFRVVERIRLVAAETTMPGVSEPVTLSAGIATDADADTLADVIRYADRALYRAKESGRNQIAVF